MKVIFSRLPHSYVIDRSKKHSPSKWICVPCEVCGLSGVQRATLLLVELSRSFPLFFIFVPEDVDCCCAVDLVSLFTTPGAYATPLPASYRKNILTQLSLEIRLLGCFEVQKFMFKYVGLEVCSKINS